MTLRWLVIVICCVANMTPDVCLGADDGVDYERQVKPLLRERCFNCHGALKQQAGLRLDTVRLMIRGGESGAVISPSDPASSVLLRRVTATDPAERMPPEHEGEPLSSQQVKLLRDWIAAGALAPNDEQPEADPKDHWAFAPVTRPPVPTLPSSASVKNPIDAFLAQQHQRRELVPQVEAPRIVLLRRLYFDLTGIPPTANEILAFKNDLSPAWYEQSVNRLLDDPRHGERWARHWMDIWRYSDWWGLGDQLRRSQQHIWHWRDWIVESLNSDTPYDEMVRLMLAADELHPNDLDKLRATGYLARNYWLFNRNQWMDETVEHVSKGFLGLTMNCAKCHDHKYDPIAHVDYYRLRAFFEPYHVRLDVLPGQPNLDIDGIPRVYDGWLDAPTYRYVRGQENNPDESTVIAPGLPEFINVEELEIESIALPPQAWQPERRPWVIEAHLAAARHGIQRAMDDFVTVREKLLENERQRDGESETEEQQQEAPASESKVAELRQKLNVAEAAVHIAQAELVSVERRAEAMQADWAATDNWSDDNQTASAANERVKKVVAVQAERELGVAKARHDVAVAELELYRTADDKRAAVEEKLKATHESLEKALASARVEVEPTDQYTRLAGAKWTPTRFVFSGEDDPPVEFVPQSSGRRTALAQWITDHRNPLTARVAVNHIWSRHMGKPLVATLFDFGLNGARPTHPELLDWLAAEFMESGWSMKHLHQVIVSSAAYRMSSSSAASEMNSVQDPDNQYWWRRVPIRLESQLVRDSILAHAGTLDLAMGGPAIPRAQQDASTRRSLYFFHSNNERNLFLTTFDEARVTECYRREQSIVPQQALALVNSSLVLDASPRIAQRLSQGAAEDAIFIRKALSVLLAIEAGDKEVTTAQRAFEAWRQLPDGSADNVRAHFVWALINHNDFVTVR